MLRVGSLISATCDGCGKEGLALPIRDEFDETRLAVCPECFRTLRIEAMMREHEAKKAKAPTSVF